MEQTARQHLFMLLQQKPLSISANTKQPRTLKQQNTGYQTLLRNIMIPKPTCIHLKTTQSNRQGNNHHSNPFIRIRRRSRNLYVNQLRRGLSSITNPVLIIFLTKAQVTVQITILMTVFATVERTVLINVLMSILLVLFFSCAIVHSWMMKFVKTNW